MICDQVRAESQQQTIYILNIFRNASILKYTKPSRHYCFQRADMTIVVEMNNER